MYRLFGHLARVTSLRAATLLTVGIWASRVSATAVTVYDNTVTFIGNYGDGTTYTNTSYITGILADDITPIAGHAGEPVTSLTYQIYNLDQTHTISFKPTAVIYAQDDGYPGDVLYSNTSPVMSLAPLTTVSMTLSDPAGLFALPSGTFWAGEYFTASPLSSPAYNLRVPLYGPPNIGSSADLMFEGTGSGTTSSSPDGNFFRYLGVSANDMYWSFATNSVPEPAFTGTILVTVALLSHRGHRRFCTRR